MTSKSAAVSPWPNEDERARGRAAKRSAVLSAAVDLFNRHGFSSTSLDDIATELGVTKPTIYHYFPSKQEILFECLTIGLNEVQEGVDIKDHDRRPGFDRLRAYLIAYAKAATSPYMKLVEATHDYDLTGDNLQRFRKIKRGIHEHILDVIDDGAKDGSISVEDPAIAALALTGALNTIPRWYAPRSGRSADTTANAIVDFLMRALEKRP